MRLLTTSLLTATLCLTLPAAAQFNSAPLLHKVASGGGTAPGFVWAYGTTSGGGQTGLTTSFNGNAVASGSILGMIEAIEDSTQQDHSPVCPATWTKPTFSTGNNPEYINVGGGVGALQVLYCQKAAGGSETAPTTTWTNSNDRYAGFMIFNLSTTSGASGTPDDAKQTDLNSHTQAPAAPSLTGLTQADDTLINNFVAFSCDATDIVSHDADITVRWNGCSGNAGALGIMMTSKALSSSAATGAKAIGTGPTGAGDGTNFQTSSIGIKGP